MPGGEGEGDAERKGCVRLDRPRVRGPFGAVIPAEITRLYPFTLIGVPQVASAPSLRYRESLSWLQILQSRDQGPAHLPEPDSLLLQPFAQTSSYKRTKIRTQTKAQTGGWVLPSPGQGPSPHRGGTAPLQTEIQLPSRFFFCFRFCFQLDVDPQERSGQIEKQRGT